MREKKSTTAVEATPSASSVTMDDVGATMGFLSEWNAEIVQFYQRRYQRYWSLPMQLRSCTTMDDLQALQEEFLMVLFDDYRDEAARLARVVNAASQRLNLGGDDAYAAELLKAQKDAAALIAQAKEQAERILQSAHRQVEAPAKAADEPQVRKSA